MWSSSLELPKPFPAVGGLTWPSQAFQPHGQVRALSGTPGQAWHRPLAVSPSFPSYCSRALLI